MSDTITRANLAALAASLLLAAGTAHASCFDANVKLPDANAFEAAVQPATPPHAVKSVHVEGLLPHTGSYDASDLALRDTTVMRNLALEWRANQSAAAYTRLVAYFNAWAGTYQPNYNPIDETRFDGLIEAYLIMRNHLPRSAEDRMRALMVTFADVYLSQMRAHAKDPTGIWVGNWNSHRVKIATMAAYASDNPILMAKARQAFLHQINVNIQPDGSVYDFHERNALHYVDYDLQPLLRAALVAAEKGDNWLDMRGSKGQSLRKAVDWLSPYADASQTHEEFVGSQVKFDQTRAEAGLPGYSGQWNPKTASDLYWSAAALDRRYLSLAKTLSATPPSWLAVYAGTCQARLPYALVD